MTGVMHVAPFPRNSVSRSGALLAPLANSVFLTIAATDLPSGYYQFDTIVGLQPKRAEVILAGACIVRTVMDKLGAERLIVSDRGLRHGVLQERFGAEDNSEARAAS